MYLTSSDCQSSHANPILGGEAPGAPPPGSAPVLYSVKKTRHAYMAMLFFLQNLMICTSVSQ